MTRTVLGSMDWVGKDPVLTTAGGPAVAIVLSIYDGARFLPDQLRSFLNQTHAEWRLLWRDDGSADDGPAILRDFARSLPVGRVACAEGSGLRLGVAGSFFSLLGCALDAPMVAFADQDDVWLPDKLRRAVDVLQGIQPDVPALYCGRQMLVDHRLQPQGLSPCYPDRPGFLAILLQNVATGCTVVMNQAAARAVFASVRPLRFMHDWWSCLFVLAIGGVVRFDPDPAILYRQHGANLMGASCSRLRRLKGALLRGAAEHNRQLMARVDALLHNASHLEPGMTQVLRHIQAAYSGTWQDRLGLFRVPGFRRQTWPETVLLGAWLLLGETSLLRRVRQWNSLLAE